jgi:hypothetical protein
MSIIIHKIVSVHSYRDISLESVRFDPINRCVSPTCKFIFILRNFYFSSFKVNYNIFIFAHKFGFYQILHCFVEILFTEEEKFLLKASFLELSFKKLFIFRNFKTLLTSIKVVKNSTFLQ